MREIRERAATSVGESLVSYIIGEPQGKSTCGTLKNVHALRHCRERVIGRCCCQRVFVTSYASKPGTPFQAVVVSPYEYAGKVLIPQGSIVYGIVERATPVGLGLIHERAGLQLAFREYETPQGERAQLNARLLSIDNDRDQVRANGRVRGILAAGNPNGLVSGFWQKPDLNLLYRSTIGLTGATSQIWKDLAMGPFGAAALIALRCTVFRFPEPEIHFLPGTDMLLEVEVPPKSMPALAAAEHSITPEPLVSWIQARPTEIRTARGVVAADRINIVFVGSRQELTDAFVNSGWSMTDARSLRTISRVYYAFSAMHDYSAAPVSKLLYQGAEPDLVFQKSLNTVSKRHHIRIWSGASVDGQQIWLGAATHDTGVTFHTTSMAFTHKIDPGIDLERSKVVADLSFSGCSETPSYVNAPNAEQNKEGHTSVMTDDRLAVLQLQTCDDIRSVVNEPGPPPPGTVVTRFSRRFILEARNYLLRDNPYYWGYEVFKWRHDTALKNSALECRVRRATLASKTLTGASIRVAGATVR
jgi:hypothetical protein